MSLRHRISLIAGTGIILIGVVLGTIGQRLYNQKDEDFRQTYLSGLSGIWKALGTSEMDKMYGNFRNLTRNRALTSALFKGELDKLRDAIGPTATRLEAMDIADNLLVITAKGDVGFSNVAGVTEPPATAMLALATGKPARGFERTSDGRLVNIVAFPIYDRADLVGVGAFEKNLDQLATAMRAATGRDVFIRDAQGQLHSQTSENLPDISQLSFDQAAYLERNVGDDVLGIGVLPLPNVRGDIVASLLTVEDITTSVAQRGRLRLFSYGTAILLLIGVTAGIWLYLKSAFRPLTQAGAVMHAISLGDLTAEVTATNDKDMARMLNAMRNMQQNLREMIRGILDAADQLSTVAEQTLQLTERASAGAQSQLGDTQSVASAMGQLSTSAEAVARNAETASAGANSANAEANKGQRNINRVSSSITTLAGNVTNTETVIRQVKDETEAIGAILNVIRDISLQTNQLALNAAIEASKAGEKGRGFAVVADEVRNLAAKTKQSTEEIHAMIQRLRESANAAVESMAEGRQSTDEVVKMIQSAASSLKVITDSVGSISNMNTNIASAAREQNDVAEEINRNLGRISEVAEETADGSRRTAETASLISEQVQQLQKQVSRFQV